MMKNVGRTGLTSAEESPPPRASDTLNGVSVLRDLYSALDSALVLIETSTGTNRDLAEGIDFYKEVRSFEISLIGQALRQAHGSQVRAAELLGLKITTLNTKIKNYSIDWKKLTRSRGLARRLRVANE